MTIETNIQNIAKVSITIRYTGLFSLLPLPCSLLPAPCSLFPVPCSLLPAPCSLKTCTSPNLKPLYCVCYSDDEKLRF
ncbi:MAG: hypothetical protein F6K65_38035 [Moorea sp. SIO3C2]|nr:hypothetical protein [Moorena sp. SIO3C2]